MSRINNLAIKIFFYIKVNNIYLPMTLSRLISWHRFISSLLIFTAHIFVELAGFQAKISETNMFSAGIT